MQGKWPFLLAVISPTALDDTSVNHLAPSSDWVVRTSDDEITAVTQPGWLQLSGRLVTAPPRGLGPWFV